MGVVVHDDLDLAFVVLERPSRPLLLRLVRFRPEGSSRSSGRQRPSGGGQGRRDRRRRLKRSPVDRQEVVPVPAVVPKPARARLEQVQTRLSAERADGRVGRSRRVVLRRRQKRRSENVQKVAL